MTVDLTDELMTCFSVANPKLIPEGKNLDNLIDIPKGHMGPICAEAKWSSI